MTAARRDAGFTLVEVVVALVILAITAVAVLQLFGGGLRLARASRDQVGATLLASAKLVEEVPEEARETTTAGQEGIYEWTRRVTPDPTLLPLPPTGREAATIRLARVAVEVRWGAGRRLEMMTLKTWSTSP